MNISYEEAYEACIQHYVDRGNSRELAMTIVHSDPENVYALYHIIQEEEARSKHIKVVDFPVGGLNTKMTVWIDDVDEDKDEEPDIP